MMRERGMPTIVLCAAGLLVLTCACTGGAPPPNPLLDVGAHEWTTRDGNVIPYEVAGNPEAAIAVVLVHCWMCDRTFWNAQLPALAEAGYRTVALDLPGHGEATAKREPWTVAAYGGDVAGLIEALGLTDVVLVGHSMGGPVSLRVAARLPGKVRGIVAVDTLHDAEFKFEGEQVERFMRAFEADFVGTCEQFVRQMFPEPDAQAVMANVTRRSCDGRRSAAGNALMRNFATIDMPAWFREAGVPIRAINAAAPNPTRVEVNRKYADFDAVLMDDVGHYLHMTRPERFNELLLAALGELAGSRA